MEVPKRLAIARWAIGAVFFIDGAYVAGLLSYLPVIKQSLHLPDDVLGRCLFFSPLGALLTIPRAGALIGRFGSQSIILVSGIGLTFLVPFAVGAFGVWPFCLALLLFGGFNGMLDATMNAQSVTIQHRYPRPMLSSTHGCWSLGGFAAAGGIALAARFGQGAVIHTVWMSAVLLVALIVACRGLLPHAEDDAGSEPSFAWPKGAVLLIGLLILCAFAAEGAAYDWTAVYVHYSLRTTQEVAAFAFGVFAVAMSVSRLTGDLFVHRLGLRATLQGGSILSAAGILLAVGGTTISTALIGLAISGIGMANVVPILFRAAGNVPGISTGTGIAAAAACGYAAFLLSPPLVGLVAVHQSLSFALGTVGALILIVGIAGPKVLSLTKLRDAA